MKRLTLAVLAVVAVMAVAANAANAAPVGSLKVAGNVLGVEEEIGAVGSGEAIKFLVPTFGVTVECKSSEVGLKGGNFITGKGGKESLLHFHGVLSATLKGCVVLEAEEVCTIYPTEKDQKNHTNAGRIDFQALVLWLGFHIITTEPLLHMDYMRLTSVPGSSGFASWYFTEECAFAPGGTISGTIALRVPDFTDEALTHSFQDLTALEESALGEEGMSLSLLYEEQPTTIDGGNVGLHLVGALEGKTYSVE